MYAWKKRLIIECEEDNTQSHLPQHEGHLDLYLESQNFRILRFCNSEILEDLEGVLRVIKEALGANVDFANAKSKSTHAKVPSAREGKREKPLPLRYVFGVGHLPQGEGESKSSQSAMETKKNVRVLTGEQKRIVDLSKSMDKNEILAIQACAGSGKTSTLEEIALANPKQRFLYLAFNKSIAAEARERFPKNVEARTIHSLAFNYAKMHLGSIATQSKISIFDLEKLVEFDFDESYDFAYGLKIFENFLKSDKTLDNCFDKKFIKFLYEATLDGKIPLTRDFVKKLYQIEKGVKYDDISFDSALKYARERLSEKIGHFKPNFKLIARFLVDLYKSDSFEHKEYRLLKRVDSIFEPIWAIVYFESSQFDKIPKRYSYIKDFNSLKELREYIEEIGDVELAQAIKLLGEFKEIEISKIQNLAQSLYANKSAKNTITNTHQSKGLEFDEVVLGGDFFDLYEKQLRAGSQEEREKFYQELNLFYVAITRAKKQLIDKSSNAELYIECNDWYNSDVLILK